jgi:hypothetical protein
LRPPDNDFLTFIAIGDAVNKAAHDGPEIQLPLAAQPDVPRPAPTGPEQASLF